MRSISFISTSLSSLSVFDALPKASDEFRGHVGASGTHGSAYRVANKPGGRLKECVYGIEDKARKSDQVSNLLKLFIRP